MVKKESEKLDEISKKYTISNLYYSGDRHNIFKRSILLLTYIEDRFKDKKFLLILFILMLIVNAFELSYNTLTILLRITNTDDILWVFILKKSSALIHTVVVQLLSWTTFVKVKSKTIIFY